MVTIKDGCGCDPCDCDWKQKLKEAYSRANQSVNKIGDNDGSVYFPDGTGFVKLPLPRQSDVAQIKTNTQDIADLKVADIQLQANITAEENARIASITAEETARKAKDENLDSDIARIDSTDARQSELIQDNTDKITSTYNDLVATEATVATHNSEIITLQANNQALAKSLVSDVIMADGTTAGSVQVSIEKEDGTLITSANYRWGKDIGIRLEAGTQAGYVKAVISLSDGTELVSNEYKIVEVLESDVYVTAITLIADQAAGTLGGNISYSNGTTQTINSVSVPTAPGVTSAIEALQGRMTAVEQKNATQDASITAIDGRVQALENTPGIGQFANGRLGTIAGSTNDGRIKAEDDGTGSVNGWSALKQRVSTAEGQIVTLESSKVNVAQGAANAGKALVVGSDGNVTPGVVSGGEVWEEITFDNWPTNWAADEKIRIMFDITVATSSPYYMAKDGASKTIDVYFPYAPNSDKPYSSFEIGKPIYTMANGYMIVLVNMYYNNFNSAPTSYFMTIQGTNRTSVEGNTYSRTESGQFIKKMWRLKH